MRFETASAKTAVALKPIASVSDGVGPRLVERTGSRPAVKAPARSGPRVSVLVLAVLAVAILGGVVLFGLGGLFYYATPLALRGAQKAHRLLRPSGTAGLVFGIAGAGLMLLTLPYIIRKKIPSLVRRGSTQRWLDFHIFCGIVGPAFITLHTSFKFNGIISVAYWSMVLVVTSGFVGRTLYMRIPRSIRGVELSLDEIHERIDDLKRRTDEAAAASRLSHAMDAEIAALDTERLLLIRRLKNLATTKKLFDLWHIFHKPLVYIMAAIAVLHVALAVYMGYSVHF
jgi:hypothetical protein